MLGLSNVTEVRSEDRIALRRAVRCEAELLPAGAPQSVSGIVTDLSVHGLWVALERPLELGATLVVSFKPPYCLEAIDLTGVVARVDEHEGDEAEFGIGLSIVDLSADDQLVLENALKGIPPRASSMAGPVIADIEHDSLEEDVVQILDEEDLREIEESGLHAIPIEDDGTLANEECETLRDWELEVFSVG